MSSRRESVQQVPAYDPIMDLLEDRSIAGRRLSELWEDHRFDETWTSIDQTVVGPYPRAGDGNRRGRVSMHLNLGDVEPMPVFAGLTLEGEWSRNEMREIIRRLKQGENPDLDPIIEDLRWCRLNGEALRWCRIGEAQKQ